LPRFVALFAGLVRKLWIDFLKFLEEVGSEVGSAMRNNRFDFGGDLNLDPDYDMNFIFSTLQRYPLCLRWN